MQYNNISSTVVKDDWRPLIRMVCDLSRRLLLLVFSFSGWWWWWECMSKVERDPYLLIVF